MKKNILWLFCLVLGLFLFSSFNDIVQARSTRTSSSDVHVNGYFRKNWTYVQPYYRTPPNSTKLDNYSCIDYWNCWGSTTTPTYSTPTYTPPVYVPPVYVAPVKTKTEICQDSFGINSYYSYTSELCYCNAWYTWNLSQTYCVLKPIKTPSEECQDQYWSNATVGSTTDTCSCKVGYQWSSDRTYCILKTKTPLEICQDAFWSNVSTDWIMNIDKTYSCFCNTWYQWSLNRKYCEIKTKTPTEICKDLYWSHVFANWTKKPDGSNYCYCDSWYQWSSDSKYCELSTPDNLCQSDESIVSCGLWFDTCPSKCRSEWTGLINTGTSTSISTGNELQSAYDYAYSIGITTANSIDAADMHGFLLRAHMAKMMVNYSREILGKLPDTTQICNFIDISRQAKEFQMYIIEACQMWLMWMGSDKFNPNWTVTRAEFWTVLSRALYGNANDGGAPYYLAHLSALEDAGIMQDISTPNVPEIRWNVMLMLQRSTK